MKKLIERTIEHDVARIRKHPIFWMYTAFGAGIYLGYVLAESRTPIK